MPRIDGQWRTRRPIGHRDEPDGPEPETSFATFLFREDAAEAAKKIDPSWQTRIQFMGYLDRWTVAARRKSWSSGREVFLKRDGDLSPAGPND